MCTSVFFACTHTIRLSVAVRLSPWPLSSLHIDGELDPPHLQPPLPGHHLPATTGTRQNHNTQTDVMRGRQAAAAAQRLLTRKLPVSSASWKSAWVSRSRAARVCPGLMGGREAKAASDESGCCSACASDCGAGGVRKASSTCRPDRAPVLVTCITQPAREGGKRR